MYGIILVNCVLYVRDVNVPELALRLVKEIRNWKNQTLLAIGFAGLVQIGLHFWHWPYENHRPHRYRVGGSRSQPGDPRFCATGTVKEAFAAKDAFQKAAASGGHIRTKIVTLKDQLAVGQPVQPAHLAESK